MSHVHYERARVFVLIAGLAFFMAGDGAGQNTSHSTNMAGTGGADQAAGEVTVYVSTDRVFSELILRAFEQRTGVRVNAVYDTEETKSTSLANKLLAEKNRPQADVFWSNEPVRTLVLKKKGVLAPYRSPNAEGIPATFKDPEGYWTGFSARSRVIVYHTNLVKPEEAPKSIFDLADPKWKDKSPSRAGRACCCLMSRCRTSMRS